MKKPNFSAMDPKVAKAIEQMMLEQGEGFSLQKINLAELERRTGITRQKLRTMKNHDFQVFPHASKGKKQPVTKITGYTVMLDDMLKNGITNSEVCWNQLKRRGFSGGKTIVKDYIASHQHLLPAPRHAIAPQGSRGQRYLTEPGEAYQMDWGFTKVHSFDGRDYNAACFAMICHHCGQRYIEFFSNAKQENLFIGMIHAFRYMGVPKTVLTDNMKSVVIRRDKDGHPIWQKDYEQFMKTVGFQTKLCKPRHPFTKGKVERLIRLVKENFLAGCVFWNLTDLNCAALEWCDEQNSAYHKGIGTPNTEHLNCCAGVVSTLNDSANLLFYLCPERRISFDGFVNYEGRRFGVPYTYTGKTARVLRDGDQLSIYSADLRQRLTTYDVTWSRRDSFCKDQYALPEQPEEFPSMPVKTVIQQLPSATVDISFEKFNFSKGDD